MLESKSKRVIEKCELLIQRVVNGLSGCGMKPVTIAPKVTLNSAHVIPVVPVSAAAAPEGSGTVFLAPCDKNGHITHFVLTAATSLNGDQLTFVPPSLLISPNNKMQVIAHWFHSFMSFDSVTDSARSIHAIHSNI